MTTMEGGCFCGALRYRVGGDFGVTHCHCIHCRKINGAAFVTWVEASFSNFAWLQGQPNEFNPRPGVTRTYCSRCGSPLTYQNRESPDSIDITAGSLDDPSELKPRDHVWFDRKLPWLQVEDDLPRYSRGRRDSLQGE
ncbi:MAG: GFA family protein [Acidobacteriota bacterium]